MATTKAPQTRAEEATKIQQQLEKHPQKAAKISKLSKLSPGVLHTEM